MQRQQETAKVKTRFPEKIIHNFLNYTLSQKEKQALSYSLDEHIVVIMNESKIKTELESFYHNILQHTVHLRQNAQDELKSKI